jgi:hypothetical protein
LSRQDIQILEGYGCPNVNKKVVFSSKLLRKHVHLDEGDVSVTFLRLFSYLFTLSKNDVLSHVARTFELHLMTSTLIILSSFGISSINTIVFQVG